MMHELIQTERFHPTEWQVADLDELGTKNYSANWSQMGCIAGDACLTFQSASGKTNYSSLEEAYLGFNRIHSNRQKNWKSSKPYKTLAFVDGRIRHHEIEAIMASGEKWVIELELETGNKIKLTQDHQVLTYPEQWVPAIELTVGDLVRIQGGKGAKHDSKRTSYKYVRVPEMAGRGAGVTRDYFREHQVVASTPPGLHTHHVDETSTNNSEGNLRKLTLQEHSRLHARDQIGSYDAPPARIVAIRDVGPMQTYDISMAAPHHNFVANGIVVHNCYKTSTGLWLIARKMQEQEITKPKILIVTTKAGKGTYWDAIPKTEELDRFATFTVHAKTVTERLFDFELDLELGTFLDKLHAKGGIALAHYHCFTNRSQLLPLLHAIEWDYVLLDEAHRIKNRKAQWTRNIKKLKSINGNRHIMTGTGFINDPSEIWSLLNFLNPKRFTTYHGFRRKYCDEVLVGGFPKVIGIKPARVEEFRDLRKEIGVRREMAEVHSHIDHPIYSDFEVDLNPTQKRMYEGIKRELYALDQQGTAISSPNVLSQLNRLRQICVATPEVIREYYDEKQERRVQEIRLTEPSSKLDAVMEIIESIEPQQQVVVFSNFRDPLSLLKVRLDTQFIPYLHMEAKHNDVERYEMWHDIFPQKQHQVFMSTLQLGGESINLTPADYCIFLDRSWSPAQNNQAVGRVYRPGQNKAVEIIYVNARKTTDQRIEKTVNEKTGWFNQIFGKDTA